ncbi:cation:proton antiporter [Bombilactobacillus thymidiniphilus]|uniref:Sodium:proton antiporter n=1 Tax=Bombilactobacillus thymidiniphilus TaxID=2923363 RepID=A0ABY4PBS1_9LACO|nr:sodium:proton antiporter [Bombilactobacillus thymidiniphilus]UQS83004.1 sodium:proton antiporter [Bombilactobacillus thymidiniphilus]
MSLFFTVLLMIIATVVANILYSLYSKIPLAFYQIGLGFAISWFPQFSHFQLKSEIFFLVIIAPLMFQEGKNTDYKVLKKNLKNVISLAVVLALVTIIVGGALVHFLWAALPLSLAFVLLSILAPTDAVAVSSITSNVEVPEPVMNTLENESLFNDASGLVVMNLALLSFATGKFHLWSSIGNFLFVFIGGVVVGALLGFIFVSLQIICQRHLFDSTSIMVPLNVMTPFLVYLMAEELHMSGILAVVAAGVVQGIYRKRLLLTSSSHQMILSSTWDIITNLLNGFVFVLLGTTLPRNLLSLAEYSNLHFTSLLLLAVILYLLMLLLRYAWSQWDLVKLPIPATEKKRNSWVIALSGVHGTITLAMAFSLPVMTHRQLVPLRVDLIFIAEIVILLSLLVPTILLPHLLPSKMDQFSMAEFNNLLDRMVNYAIQELRENDDQDAVILQRVITLLNSQKMHRDRIDVKTVRQIFEKTGAVEFEKIDQLAQDGQIKYRFASQYNRHQLIHLQRMSNNPWLRVKLWLKWLQLRWRFKKLSHKYHFKYDPEHSRFGGGNRKQLWQRLENQGYLAVMNYLNDFQSTDNLIEVQWVRHYYENRHQKYNQSELDSDQEQQLIIQAFQYEYYFVQQEMKKHKLTADLVSALNEKISADQFVYMTSDD